MKIFQVSHGFTAGVFIAGGITGIDYSQPRHTQYVVNKDNQVVFARYYLNQGPYTETQKKSKRILRMGKYIHITQTSILLGDLLKRYNTTMMKIYLLILLRT